MGEGQGKEEHKENGHEVSGSSSDSSDAERAAVNAAQRRSKKRGRGVVRMHLSLHSHKRANPQVELMCSLAHAYVMCVRAWAQVLVIGRGAWWTCCREAVVLLRLNLPTGQLHLDLHL